MSEIYIKDFIDEANKIKEKVEQLSKEVSPTKEISSKDKLEEKIIDDIDDSIIHINENFREHIEMELWFKTMDPIIEMLQNKENIRLNALIEKLKRVK